MPVSPQEQFPRRKEPAKKTIVGVSASRERVVYTLRDDQDNHTELELPQDVYTRAARKKFLAKHGVEIL